MIETRELGRLRLVPVSLEIRARCLAEDGPPLAPAREAENAATANQSGAKRRAPLVATVMYESPRYG